MGLRQGSYASPEDGGRHLGPRLDRRFNALWAGQSISLLGDYVAYITLPLFILGLTDDALAFGQAYALENAPVLAFGLFGGVLLDRLPLRPLLVFTDVARAAAFFGLAVSAGSGTASLGTVFLVAFLVGSFGAAFTSGLLAYLPRFVPRELLTPANARMAMSQQIAFVVGPMLGGVVVAVAGFETAFVLNGATFLVSAVSLMLAGRPRTQVPVEASSYLKATWAGFAILWRDRRLRAITAAAAAANFVVGFLEATFVLLGDQILGITDEAEFGIMFAAMGVGGLLGAFTAPWAGRKLGLGRALVVGLIFYGIGYISVTFASTPAIGLVLLGATMVGLSWLNIGIVTLRQILTPEAFLGRVTAAGRSLSWGALPFGALIGAVLADRFGFIRVARAAPVLLVSAGIMLIGSQVWSSTSDARPLDDPHLSPKPGKGIGAD